MKIDNEIMNKKLFISSIPSQNRDAETLVKEISIKYCKPEEVNKNRKDFLLFKGTFAQRQEHLKLLGEKVTTYTRIDDWIHGNIDELYPKFLPLYRKDLKKKGGKQN